MVIFGATGALVAHEALDRMQVALRRRLPTACRAQESGAVLAGPSIVRAGEIVLVASGVLYGGATWPEVAAELAQRGPAPALTGLEGAFAFAALDRRTGALHLARDATGQRALYVSRARGGVAFASESKALFARGDIDLSLDPLALARYLSFAYLPGEASLVRGVSAVPPGTVWTFDREGRELSRTTFWRPVEPADLDARESRAREDGAELERYASDLRRSLEAVVADNLASTAHLGRAAAFLSGGVDSSLVVALAARAGQTPECFSISFGDELPNELAWSRMVAEHVGAPHHVVTIDPGAMGGELDETLYCLDEPIGDPLTVPNYLVARAASRAGFRRALNGEGGDPCFGGPKNIPMMLASWYEHETPGERERAYVRAYQKLFDDLPGLFSQQLQDQLREEAPVEAILTPFFEDPHTQSFLNKLQHVNVVLKGGDHILVKVEKMYGAHGVVPLSPLFDRRIADRAWEVPPSLKLRGNVEKFVLKEAVRDLLPEAITGRKKSGMLVPVHPWLKGPMGALARELLGPEATRRRGFFDPKSVSAILGYRGAASVRGYYGAKVWLLLTLEVWCRLFLDGGARRYESGVASWQD